DSLERGRVEWHRRRRRRPEERAAPAARGRSALMALLSTRAQDYYIRRDGSNMTPGVPAGAYTGPAKGHLVIQTTGANNEWGLAGNNSNFSGIVESVNNNDGTLSVAELFPKSSLILQQDGSCVLGNTVQATATALGTTIGRTVVKDAIAAGVGKVIALNPRGANTVQVEF